MALSVTVHGFMTLAGTQPAGRWATADITEHNGDDVLVYTVPSTVEYMIVAISLTNRLDYTADGICIAISQSDDPEPSEFVEWNSSVTAGGTLERTQILLNANDKIFVRWENESYELRLDDTSDPISPGNNLVEGETANFLFKLRDVNVPDPLAYTAPDIYWTLVDATTDDFVAVSGTVTGDLATSEHNGLEENLATYPISIQAQLPFLNPGVYTLQVQKTDAAGRYLDASTVELVTA